MNVGILGLGSVLMGDDALGPYAVELLAARWSFPDGVSLLDAGTPGPDLVDHLAGLDAVIVLDAVRAAGVPGEVRLFRREELLALPPSARVSPHDPDLQQALLTAELAGGGPEEVLLVGMVPGRVELGTGLSAEVREVLPAVEAVVVAELRRLGVEPLRRTPGEPPRIWWERDGAEAPASQLPALEPGARHQPAASPGRERRREGEGAPGASPESRGFGP